MRQCKAKRLPTMHTHIFHPLRGSSVQVEHPPTCCRFSSWHSLSLSFPALLVVSRCTALAEQRPVAWQLVGHARRVPRKGAAIQPNEMAGKHWSEARGEFKEVYPPDCFQIYINLNQPNRRQMLERGFLPCLPRLR